jgi:hypothetical protein
MDLRITNVPASGLHELLRNQEVYASLQGGNYLRLFASDKRPALLTLIGTLLISNNVTIVSGDASHLAERDNLICESDRFPHQQPELKYGYTESTCAGIWLDLDGKLPSPTCDLVDLGLKLRGLSIVRGISPDALQCQVADLCHKVVEQVENFRTARRGPIVVVISADPKMAYLFGFLVSGLGRFPWILFVQVDDDTGKLVSDGDRDWHLRPPHAEGC